MKAASSAQEWTLLWHGRSLDATTTRAAPGLSVFFAEQAKVQEIVSAYLVAVFQSTGLLWLGTLKYKPQSVVMWNRDTWSTYLHPSSVFCN